MAYTAFDKAVPDGTHSGPTVINEIKSNLLAARDMVVIGAAKGWNYSTTTATFTGSWSSTTLTCSSISAGQIVKGMTIYQAGVAKGIVTGVLTGSNHGVGTYSMDTTQTYGAATAFTGASADPTQVCSDQYTNSTEKLLSVLTWSSGNCTSEVWYYSSDTGATWNLIGTETFTYDGSSNLTASTWS